MVSPQEIHNFLVSGQSEGKTVRTLKARGLTGSRHQILHQIGRGMSPHDVVTPADQAAAQTKSRVAEAVAASNNVNPFVSSRRKPTKRSASSSKRSQSKKKRARRTSSTKKQKKKPRKKKTKKVKRTKKKAARRKTSQKGKGSRVKNKKKIHLQRKKRKNKGTSNTTTSDVFTRRL